MFSGLRLTLCILALFPVPALGSDTPFEWPESYALTITETRKGNFDEPFINITHTSGFNTRNQIVSPHKQERVEIFRMQERKRIIIRPGRAFEIRSLPPDWPTHSTIFPKHGSWTRLGRDKINGDNAIKYMITRDQSQARHASARAPYVIMWFTEDMETPLRMEDGDTILEFSDYHAGPQDPGLFEPPY